MNELCLLASEVELRRLVYLSFFGIRCWYVTPSAGQVVAAVLSIAVFLVLYFNGSIAFEPQVADIIFGKQPEARLSDPAYLARFVGDYALGAQTLTVGLVGNTLTLTVPGQPQYHLVAGLGGKLTLEEYSVVSISFELDTAGEAVALTLYRPSGVFTAERQR